MGVAPINTQTDKMGRVQYCAMDPIHFIALGRVRWCCRFTSITFFLHRYVLLAITILPLLSVPSRLPLASQAPVWSSARGTNCTPPCNTTLGGSRRWKASSRPTTCLPWRTRGSMASSILSHSRRRAPRTAPTAPYPYPQPRRLGGTSTTPWRAGSWCGGSCI